MFPTCQKQPYKFQDRLGAPITIYPLNENAVTYLIELYDHMSPESLYNRFHANVHDFDEKRKQYEAERLADIPRESGKGWMAFASGDVVGLDPSTRIVVGGMRVIYPDPSDRKIARVSAAVRDDLHGRGIGTHLFQYAADWAKRRGVEKLVATILPGNAAVRRSLQKLSYGVHFDFDGEVDVVNIYLSRTAEYMATFA